MPNGLFCPFVFIAVPTSTGLQGVPSRVEFEQPPCDPNCALWIGEISTPVCSFRRLADKSKEIEGALTDGIPAVAAAIDALAPKVKP